MRLPIDFNEQLKLSLSFYKKHKLLTITKGQHYLLKRPVTSNHHVHVVFLTGRIGLTGDACLGPTLHGLWSVGGYGVEWFSGKLSPDYLCEKFLRNSYDAKATASLILDWYRETKKSDAELAKLFKERVDDLAPWESELEKQIELICEDTSDGGELSELLNGDFAGLDFETPCHTYGESAAPLVAVQQTFARLYSKEEKKTNALRNN